MNHPPEKLRLRFEWLKISFILFLAGPLPAKMKTILETNEGVVITLRAAPDQPSKGKEEIVITGPGSVTLRTLGSSQGSIREVTGSVGPDTVKQLLALMKAQGFERWDGEKAPDQSHYVVKTLTLYSGTTVKKEVVIYKEEFPEFARVHGAILMLAAQACPQALQGFFERL